MIPVTKMWTLELLCVSLVTAVPLSSFYPYGPTASDIELDSIDDGSSASISTSVPFIFYGKSYTTVYVNNNGMITVGGKYYDCFPMSGTKFPITSTSIRPLVASIVAPFMADVDNTVGNGNVWYRLTSNATLLSKAKNEIPVALSGQNYNPTLLFIATWDHVGYYSQHTDKNNTFQCILVTNSSHTYCIFKYADGMIQWTSGDNQAAIGMLEAQIGFNAGDGVKYAIIPGSLTTSIVNISRTSNVGVPGQWITQISSTNITIADVNMCAPNAGKGPCEQKCTNIGRGSFICSCYQGYTLYGYSCLDVNECTTNGGKGPCLQVCTNTIGSYNCSCYTCLNGLCINGSCLCTEMYIGSNCSHPVFSGCEVNPCLNGGLCLPGLSGICSCPGNTTGQYCETTIQSCIISNVASSAISNLIARRRYLGATQSLPAKDCAEIKNIRTEVTNGVYWTLSSNQTVQLVFCQYS